MTKVTVLLPCFNGMPYLPNAVESVFAQTLSDWVLLIVNDGSTDDSADYLKTLTDPRVRVVHQQNQGLAGALNTGLGLCDTEYLARLDSDDIALPSRLEKQLGFLERHPHVGLVGTQIAWHFQNRTLRGGPLPCDHRSIDLRLMRGIHAICHSSIMCRAASLLEIGGYWPDGVAEDWDMYLRMGEHTGLANLNEVLLHVGVVPNGIQSSQMASVRVRIAYACELARLRRASRSTITFEEFKERRTRTPRWQRAMESLDTFALTQYRKAQPEILGSSAPKGYARLALAAISSPIRAWQRVTRMAESWASAVYRKDHCR